ncbi:MAG: cadherin-like domain-containing protein, partial [Rhodospirillales bacterium]|nr:cadherin-like domain-containing protein [Rhodospirillales bacterium]
MTGGTFPKFAKLSSHHAPRKRGWSGLGALFMLVTVAALVAWTPEAGAFDNWTDTATGDFDTNCAQCHGNFRSNGYVSLKDGSPWSTSLMNGHRDFVSGECDVCHNSGGRFPAYTLWSAGGTGFENISCAGCHGRGDNATPPAPGDNNQTCVEDPTAYGGDAAICGAGAGLRRQHWTANRTIDTANGPVSTQICATCHADADPANLFTPVDEDVPPSYYFTPDPIHATKPTDPCNANPAAAGAESKFGPTGLDNDGDGLVDGADADCIAVNLPPVAVDDAYTTDEDTPLVVAAPGVLTNDSDPENDPITAVPNTGPASGSLTLNTDGSFSYTPNADFNGTDSFTYFANDGTSNSDLPATVTITVNAINDPPVAVNDSYTTDEDVPLNVPATGVLANDTDVDGDALTAVLVPASGPDNGSLTLNSDGSFTYTPNANFNGDDSFRYVANDGQANSNEATVTITVNAVNDPPVAVDDSYVTDEDVPLTVTAPGVLANDTDADGDTLTAALVTDVSNGTLALAADGSFSYTPDANFNGDDTFTYVANDGQADSNVATVTITVNAVNDPPVAVDDSYTTDEDVTLTVTAPGV